LPLISINARETHLQTLEVHPPEQGKTDSNWNKYKILDIVDCKEAEHLEELDMEVSRDLMVLETSK
jgi:hypothetical protein